jgi:hypothetical protein
VANNHIELVGNESRLAGTFRSLVSRATNLQDDMRRMKFIMDESGAADAAPDWAAIEALFGFRAGQAQPAYSLLKLAAIKVNSADVDNFCNRIG